MPEKRRKRIPLKPEFTSKPKEKPDSNPEHAEENKAEDIPQPGELTQTKEEPEGGNIGKNNAGGYENKKP